MSTDPDDKEAYKQDYLSNAKQKTLEIIRDQLEPLFFITKGLEGNADIDDGACKASHGALQEQLPMLEHLLSHFENLEKEAKAGRFNRRIQESITLAQTKTQVYYKKTDALIAWIALLVLHPRQKQAYFEKHQTGTQKPFVNNGKKALQKLQETRYKNNLTSNRVMSPDPLV